MPISNGTAPLRWSRAPSKPVLRECAGRLIWTGFRMTVSK